MKTIGTMEAEALVTMRKGRKPVLPVSVGNVKW
jgi:hypothetical protein